MRNAVSGDNALLSRGLYYYELGRFGPTFLNVPLYLGGSIEYGNVFEDRDDIRFGDMLLSGSVFLGAATPVGPFYLGYGHTEGGDQAVFLLVGGVF
jgi:NTE family protein